MSMTDKEVVDGAERMARALLAASGYSTTEASIRKSQNPRAQNAWATVTAMLDAYNGTDLQSAVDSVDEEDEQPAPVVLGAGHLAALMKSKIGSCTCLTKTPEARYHHENCLYRQLCEIEQVMLAR
ncbi:hypothetical protein WJ96_04545 [Burkholderia ubonensis]|uniref:Uncharacterized protein n=2 Tax=Burkholderia ubonensis TaxID=101571 RepID=A0AAW3MXX3_9BURK|nr:hypothetical protein [Burkholderia ubonensis]KVP65642.1 hypothetical protein WJ93_24280 [Burkholderia ubonensis]KVP97845.1 hypothetical protein WJ96_04545 [Burkholderia ubonensis]KVZ92542.1 hypothetical protein WL25_16200 [Burkholderia ubonensis]